jgi:hypothetical protein
VGVSQASPIDAAAIQRTCERALWDPRPDPAEQRSLIAELEEYVRLFAPKLATLAPRMQKDMQRLARMVLRHADELLDQKAPTADLPTRLHDAGVNARALLALLERPGELTPDEKTASQAPDRWLITVPPQQPPEA